jgi:hypothetical protein
MPGTERGNEINIDNLEDTFSVIKFNINLTMCVSIHPPPPSPDWD